MKRTLTKWKRRQLLKIKCVEYLGGQCSLCGYNKCLGALDFHHRDERTKVFGISKGIMSEMAWSNLVIELDKCVIYCANCHREEHWNVFNDVNLTLMDELDNGIVKNE